MSTLRPGFEPLLRRPASQPAPGADPRGAMRRPGPNPAPRTAQGFPHLPADGPMPAAVPGAEAWDPAPAGVAFAQASPPRPFSPHDSAVRQSRPGAASVDPAFRAATEHRSARTGQDPSIPPRAASAMASQPAARQGARSDGSADSRAPTRSRDPSPSRLAYRLDRLWLTPLIRRLVTMGLPVALLAGVVAVTLSDHERRLVIAGLFHDLRSTIENRPEFMVHSLSVFTETPELAQAIVSRLDLTFPVSSFRLDLNDLRTRAEALDAVESAALRIRSGGVLELTATEREPVAVWRHPGGLELLDVQGRRLAVVMDRNARPDLPLVAGEGAPRALAEARQLLVAAQPLAERVIGLVRISERRWDIVLTGDQRIMLPAEGALPALERVLALHAAQDLLSREVTAVDMRNPARPTIRVSRPAIEALTQVRRQETGGRAR